MAGGGSARDLARQGLGGPGDDPKDPPAQRLTVGRGGAVLSTKSRSSRENRSGLLGVRDVPGVVEDSRLPGSGRALDRVRHRDHPVAPATTVAALVDPPTRLLRSAFLQAWNDGLVVIVFIRSSDKYTLPLGLQAFSNKRNRLGPVMAVAVLLLDPPILVFATGPPTTQPVDPVATTRPGAAGDTAESTPTQGKTTESKVTPSTKPDRRRFGTASGRSCTRSPTWSGRSPAVSPSRR